MKTIIIIISLLTSLTSQAQNNFGWTSSIDVTAKASVMLGIAPTITFTQDYEGFRFGGEYSYSLSRLKEYRHNTIQGLIGINFHNASIELGLGKHINGLESAFAWSFGGRFRFDNRLIVSAKIGSDFTSVSVGYTVFKYNSRK